VNWLIEGRKREVRKSSEDNRRICKCFFVDVGYRFTANSQSTMIQPDPLLPNLSLTMSETVRG